MHQLGAVDKLPVEMNERGVIVTRIAVKERVFWVRGHRSPRPLIDDVRSAPIPDEIARDPELEGIYLDALENVLNGSNPGADGRWETEDDVRCSEGSGSASCGGAPIPRALGAFEFCLTLATRVRWFNQWSQQCEQELNQLDRARFPLAAELRGTASFIQNQVAQPGAVELSTEEAEGESAETSGVPQAGET